MYAPPIEVLSQFALKAMDWDRELSITDPMPSPTNTQPRVMA